ncbi:MAG: hypothetical protein HeimC2_26370 [Candidatus Heimdallarchaeota archaeon LC_2]|nr:MAG: hypothetical protein HeimC2_26370 [Candidatus Heimdallarchaeota archaeon LC_2]
MNLNIKKLFHRYLDIDNYPDESKSMISTYFLLSGLMYIALRDYHEHEELHDPLFMYIAETEDIGGSVSLMNLPKHWKSEKLIKKSWMKLMKVAEADGFISPDEQKLLRQIISDLQSYTLLLEDALGDSLIDSEERKLLLAARKTLLQNAEVIGKMDDEISDDEKAIINKLKSIVNQFEKAEAQNYLKKKKKSTKKRRKRS